eukprot:1270435-Prymnesium_polylepis.1
MAESSAHESQNVADCHAADAEGDGGGGEASSSGDVPGGTTQPFIAGAPQSVAPLALPPAPSGAPPLSAGGSTARRRPSLLG